MGRGIFIKHKSQWCPTKGIWVKQGGVWCPVKKVYTKINRRWCLCFPPDDSCSYTITQFEGEFPEYLMYSAGIDATVDGCFLLHQHNYYNWDTGENWLNVEFFDSDGSFIMKAVSFDGAWPQCVKRIGDKIWFSYIEGIDSGFYSIPWDKTLQIYPVNNPNLVVPLPYNWKIARRDFDGKLFMGGLAGTNWEPPSPDPHTIFYFIEETSSITPIVEIGGYSCGFAFDSEGNLWAGEYLLDFEGGMHIQPCRLGMWPRDHIDAAIEQGGPICWDSATEIIYLEKHPFYPDRNLYWGVNDIEIDSDDNVYVSVNAYEQFQPGSIYRALIKVYKNENGVYQKEYLILEDKTNNYYWDWFRSMTIDGDTLILDIDHNQMDPDSPDTCQVIQI